MPRHAPHRVFRMVAHSVHDGHVGLWKGCGWTRNGGRARGGIGQFGLSVRAVVVYSGHDNAYVEQQDSEPIQAGDPATVGGGVADASARHGQRVKVSFGDVHLRRGGISFGSVERTPARCGFASTQLLLPSCSSMLCVVCLRSSEIIFFSQRDVCSASYFHPAILVHVTGQPNI